MRLAIALIVVACSTSPLLAQVPDTVFMEDLTWTEVRDALRAGKTTVVIPTGGTEQNGPHMVLGKHNYLVKYKAGEIAKRLGNTLVAPVMAYVPEGDVDPPTGHMRFSGTITTPQDVFAKVLEFAARSLKQHGVRDIALLGDSGGNQAAQKLVAEALNKEWASTPVRVHHLTDERLQRVARRRVQLLSRAGRSRRAQRLCIRREAGEESRASDDPPEGLDQRDSPSDSG